MLSLVQLSVCEVQVTNPYSNNDIHATFAVVFAHRNFFNVCLCQSASNVPSKATQMFLPNVYFRSTQNFPAMCMLAYTWAVIWVCLIFFVLI